MVLIGLVVDRPIFVRLALKASKSGKTILV